MKTGLPENHGLSEAIIGSPLLRRNGAGEIELTDVQHLALTRGVARSARILAVAPTSSGKTDVALYGAASWMNSRLADGGRVVFLTSHRALARQKFQELRDRLGPLFALDASEIVLATGDDVVDAASDPVPDAFAVPLLVGTYEKYLNMLAGAGLSAGPANTCCIADEIQLIGDPTRGQNVEILLTLLRERVGQIIGLSAVLEKRYAQLLATWLRAELLHTTIREVPLIYELRTPSATYTTSTTALRQPERAAARTIDTIGTLRELLKQSQENEPIAVFCMAKREVFELAEQWAAEATRIGAKVDEQLPLFREPTTAADELGRYLPHRFAYHTADLNEEERVVVETKLEGSTLRVVFATTTLAAGLNFSFKTVIIHNWRRWNQDLHVREPISRGEFHNMAGRAGRLSRVDTAGRVIFFASNTQELRAAPRYLSWWELDDFSPRVHPSTFPQLTLQLLAAKITPDEDGLFAFLQHTFSAERELERNARQPELWRDAVARAVEDLRAWRFVT